MLLLGGEIQGRQRDQRDEDKYVHAGSVHPVAREAGC